MQKLLPFFFIVIFGLDTNAQSNIDNSTPVRLKTFEVAKTEMGNTLHWSVSCFITFARFEIQRSPDGTNYKTINTFQADVLRCLQPFEYEDKAAMAGKMFYRIRVGDVDGNFFSSKIVVVTGKLNGFDIAAMYPTVVNSTATISVSSSNNNTAKLQVYNFQGKKVLEQTSTLKKGSNEIILDCTNLSKSTYILAVQNSEGELKTIQFVKQ